MQAPSGLHGQGPLSDSPILTQPPPPPHQRQSAGMRQPPSDEGSAQQPFLHQGSAQQAFSSQDSMRQPYPNQGSMQQPFPRQRSTQQPYSGQGSAQLPPGLPFVQSQQLNMHSGASHSGGEVPRQHSGVQILPARQPRQHQSLDHNVGLQTAGSSGWDHDLSSFNPDAGTSAMHEDFASRHAQQPQFERPSSGASAQHAPHLARPSFGRSSSGSSAQHAQHASVTGLFQRMDVGSQMSHPQPSSSQHGHGGDYSSSHLADGQSRQSGQYGAGSSSFRLTDKPQLGVPSQPRRRLYEPHKQPPSKLHAGDHSFGFGEARDHMQPPMHVQPSQEDGWDASTPQGYYQQSQSDLHSHSGFGHQPSSRNQVAGSTSAFGSAPADDEFGRASYSSSQDGHGFGLSQRHRSAGLAARTSSGKVLTVARPSYFGTQGSHQGVEANSLVEPQSGPPPGLDYSTGMSMHMHGFCVFACSAGSRE